MHTKCLRFGAALLPFPGCGERRKAEAPAAASLLTLALPRHQHHDDFYEGPPFGPTVRLGGGHGSRLRQVRAWDVLKARVCVKNSSTFCRRLVFGFLLPPRPHLSLFLGECSPEASLEQRLQQPPPPPTAIDRE